MRLVKRRMIKILVLLVVLCTLCYSYSVFHPLLFQQLNLNLPTEQIRANVCPEGNLDCIRFQKLLQQWPKDKPKAAIYILTKEKRFLSLRDTLKSIDTFFTHKYGYPIIIFYESNSQHNLKRIKSFTNSSLYFQEVNFTVPKNLPESTMDKYDLCRVFGKGYKNMCRFQAKLIYEQPIVQGLEFHWRLDDDSRLLREVKYDVFKFMNIHELDYGYSYMTWDRCIKGLWEATTTYIERKQIKTQFFNEWRRSKIYYNNFEITRMSVWQSTEYREYVDYIDKLGGIYTNRWGDAPIKSIAVSMFVPQNRTHQFTDIGYQHSGYVNP